ncbi:MAG: MBL fold metallo-hydrolase [Elusimicrobiota bacterium]
MTLETLTVGYLSSNCYILYTDNAVIIDPGAESERIIRTIDKLSVPVSHIIYTHAHWDHIGAGYDVKSHTGAEVLLGKRDLDIFHHFRSKMEIKLGAEVRPAEPDRLVEDGDIIKSGSMELKIMETPGHTPGGISINTNGMLFSGDVIFYNSIGRTDLPGGSMDELKDSILNKIYKLDDNVEIFPGHGSTTTIGREKQENPFIRSGTL